MNRSLDAITAYLDLSELERQDSTKILNHLTNLFNSPVDVPTELRRKLLSTLISSLPPSPLSLTSTTTSTVILTTFSLIKLFGRSAAGSEELGREKALTVFLNYGGLDRIGSRKVQEEILDIKAAMHRGRQEDEDEDCVQIEPDPLLPYESEALRCLCNTLTLHPSSRTVFPALLIQQKSWLDGLVKLLAVQGAGFLAGRLLFLLTSTQGDLVVELTEKGDLVRVMTEYSTRYLSALRSPSAASLSTGPMPTISDTLQEHLKTIYNLMLQYGRSRPSPASTMTSPVLNTHPSSPIVRSPSIPGPLSSNGEEEDGESTVLSASSSAVDLGSQPVSPAIGAGGGASENPSSSNIVGTVSPKKKKRFWESSSKSREDLNVIGESSSSRKNSPGLFGKLFKDSSSPSASPNLSQPPPAATTRQQIVDSGEGPLADDLSLSTAQHFLPLFPNLIALSVLLPLGDDPAEPSRLLRHATDTLLNFPVALEELDGFATSWLQAVPSATIVYPTLSPLASRLLDLLARGCEAHFPVSAVFENGGGAKGKGKGKGVLHPDEILSSGMGRSTKAEEILGPLVLLLSKVTMLAEPAKGLREIIFPNDLDRSIPLEQRHDLTGHLVRLLSSILLPNTSHGVGELLYNLCDRNPTLFSTTIGYGNASGFLQNLGELIPPPDIPLPIPSLTSNPMRNSLSMTSAAIASKLTPSIHRRHHSETTSVFPTTTSTTSTSPFPTGPSSRTINPITGAYDPLPSPANGPTSTSPAMTEEEKLLESERLFVLFDRMSRSGVMSVENPVRKARAEGRLEDSKEDERREREEQEREEQRDEEEVERDMKAFKERKRVPTMVESPRIIEITDDEKEEEGKKKEIGEVGVAY